MNDFLKNIILNILSMMIPNITCDISQYISLERFFFSVIFLACGNSTPVRVEHEDGTAACFAGTLVAPSVQGHRLPTP